MTWQMTHLYVILFKVIILFKVNFEANNILSYKVQ